LRILTAKGEASISWKVKTDLTYAAGILDRDRRSGGLNAIFSPSELDLSAQLRHVAARRHRSREVMESFLRSLLPLMLAVVLGVTATPAHAGAAEHSTHAGHALHDDGHCASHQDQGHATMAECVQGGHCIYPNQWAAGLAYDAAGTWHPAHDESAKAAPSEVLTPPPRSA
jgi:hypothetical protein